MHAMIQTITYDIDLPEEMTRKLVGVFLSPDRVHVITPPAGVKKTKHRVGDYFESVELNDNTLTIKVRENVDSLWKSVFVRFLRTKEILSNAELGMTRDQIKELLGPPTDWSALHKKGQPHVLKYQDIELHFTSTESDATLWLVYSEDPEGNPTTWSKA